VIYKQPFQADATGLRLSSEGAQPQEHAAMISADAVTAFGRPMAYEVNNQSGQQRLHARFALRTLFASPR
jgi:hypothetical protein